MTEEIRDQIQLRRMKLNQLREEGFRYPNGFHPENLAVDLHRQYQDFTKEELAEKKNTVSVAGRMMTRRLMGKASFMNCQDRSGVIQVYFRRDDLPEGQYEAFKQTDLGDVLGIRGTLFRTRTGELSIHATEFQLLTKSLHPLPEKYHGLSDHEMCYRQRYVDLMTNDETRQRFRVRSQVVSFIRKYLESDDFLEVETPMMQVLAGGATARPFSTHHHALDIPLHLRVAPELYLKRLVVGGFERVFEINRNFRNEGISTRHNPEFTMLESYR